MAGVVFSGMLVCVVLTLISYLRASNELIPGRFTSRSLAGGLQWAVREAASMTTLYAPDRATLEKGFAPSLEHPLVFARAGPSGPELVGMGLNPATQRLERLVYETASYPSRMLRSQPVGDAVQVLVRLEPGDSAARLLIRLSPPRGTPFQTGLTLPFEVFQP